MQYVQDFYIIQPADAAAVFCGRGYNVSLGQWETLAGVALTPRGGPVKDYRLKGVDIRAYHASGAIASGVRIWIASIVDTLHTECVIPLVDGCQSVSHTVFWQGDAPMGAGLVWRVPLGGLIATDSVGIGVVYEQRT